eukprot:gene31219-37730_t
MGDEPERTSGKAIKATTTDDGRGRRSILFENICDCAVMSRQASKQTFYFLRHGITETNEFMHKVPWGSEGFYDPGFFDTQLSCAGIEQCQDAHRALRMHKNNLMVLSANLASNERPKTNSHVRPQTYAMTTNINHLSRHLAADLSNIDLLLVSPLTRTLQTATYIFQHEEEVLPANVPKISHPLLAERVYLAADTGRRKENLAHEFPHFDHRHLPTDDDWWFKQHADFVYNTYTHTQMLHDTDTRTSEGLHHVHAHYATPSAPLCHPYEEWRPASVQPYPTAGEPKHFFRSRMQRARQYLLSLPYNNVVVVSHWGVIRALTGKETRNCEVLKVAGADLLSEPWVEK